MGYGRMSESLVSVEGGFFSHVGCPRIGLNLIKARGFLYSLSQFPNGVA